MESDLVHGRVGCGAETAVVSSAAIPLRISGFRALPVNPLKKNSFLQKNAPHYPLIGICLDSKRQVAKNMKAEFQITPDDYVSAGLLNGEMTGRTKYIHYV